MSTIDASQDTAHDAHGHDHDHPPFLAHHFETPEQQFDAGKLGIWLFLVTEVLFFSGMFCAYALFRMLRPDVFEGCSQFLNTKLGAINTGVLLFSSLTMAWAVRCAQIENHKGLVANLSATLSCAMVFLGVKAIEYSHKWSMGLLPAGLYHYDPNNPHPADSPPYLLYLCAPFALMLVAVVVWLVISIIKNNRFHIEVAKPLTVVCAFFFVGVGLGTILESGDTTHAGDHAAAHDGEHAEVGGDAHSDEAAHAAADEGHSATQEVAHAEPTDTDPAHSEEHAHETSANESAPDAVVEVEDPVLERMAADPTNSAVQSELAAIERQLKVAGSSIVTDESQIVPPITKVEENVLTPRKAGVFFSIYYCMTGVHAIHILGGIVVLVWLLFRAVRQDFNRQYFGPVDYVGLYWHLVDLIWIYLFPLLYLIR